MSLVKEKIDYNYREMIELAAELSGIAEELKSIKGTFDGTLDNLGAYWKGKSSDDYRSQGADVSGLMNKNLKSLDAVAAAVKSTAKTYREAEYQKLEEK